MRGSKQEAPRPVGATLREIRVKSTLRGIAGAHMPTPGAGNAHGVCKKSCRSWIPDEMQAKYLRGYIQQGKRVGTWSVEVLRCMSSSVNAGMTVSFCHSSLKGL